MKYRMKADSKIEPKAVAGTIVYDQRGPDYGLARDDERMFGFACQTVTLNENGDYPGFVVPSHDLERMTD
jgi:hypothetical protein